MRFLHTMVRVNDLDKSLDFYCNKLGMELIRRRDYEAGRFTLAYLAAPVDIFMQMRQKPTTPLNLS